MCAYKDDIVLFLETLNMSLPAINQANTKRPTITARTIPRMEEMHLTANIIQYAKLKAPATIINIGIYGWAGHVFRFMAPTGEKKNKHFPYLLP